MSRNLKLIVISSIVVISSAFGVYLYRKTKDPKNTLNIDDVEKKDITDEIKTVLEVETTKDYSDIPEIITLKEDIARAYYVMDILRNDNGKIINTDTSNEVNKGVLSYTYDRIVREIKDLKSKLSYSGLDSDQKDYSNRLISKLELRFNTLFKNVQIN